MSDETNSTFEREILQRLTRVETKLDMQLNTKDIAVDALNLAKNGEHRLNKMEDNQRWLWRAVFATALGIAAKWVFS